MRKISIIITAMVFSICASINIFALDNGNTVVYIPSEIEVSELYNTSDYEALKTERNSILLKNYNEIYRSYERNSYDSYEDYYNWAVNHEFGVHSFFVKNFKNLSEKDILIKEILFLRYLNENGYTIDKYANFVPATYSVYETFLFLKDNNKINLLKPTKEMSLDEKKDFFRFFADNIESFLSETNSNVLEIYDSINLELGEFDTEFEQEIIGKYFEAASRINSYGLDRINNTVTEARLQKFADLILGR